MTERPLDDDGRDPEAAAGDPGVGPGIPMTAGLCARCVHARRIVSGRGSAFVLCGAAASDPLLARYPPLPRWRCHGFEQSAASDAVLEADAPPRPTPGEIDRWASWAAVVEGATVRAGVPAVEALVGLLDKSRGRWREKVAVGWSMHGLLFTPIGSREPFPLRVVVAWSDGVFLFKLLADEFGRGSRVVAADRCFAPNAQIVLDAFLYQLTGETAV